MNEGLDIAIPDRPGIWSYNNGTERESCHVIWDARGYHAVKLKGAAQLPMHEIDHRERDWKYEGEHSADMWKRRYDEMIETCAITGQQRDAALESTAHLAEKLKVQKERTRLLESNILCLCNGDRFAAEPEPDNNCLILQDMLNQRRDLRFQFSLELANIGKMKSCPQDVWEALCALPAKIGLTARVVKKDTPTFTALEDRYAGDPDCRDYRYALEEKLKETEHDLRVCRSTLEQLPGGYHEMDEHGSCRCSMCEYRRAVEIVLINTNPDHEPS